MLPNNHDDIEARLADLLTALKRVYASTFCRAAKSYMQATPYRLEEEKMAVVIQKLVGKRHGDKVYPELAGVAGSYNYYPTGPMTPEDGIASVALGLGSMVLEGGRAVRFSPKYPQHPIQQSTVNEILSNSQNEFYALELPDPQAHWDSRRELKLVKHDLSVAEADGVLQWLASTYSPDNETIYDGTSREGPRVVTFAPILKQEVFPLPAILDLVMKFGQRGMSSPVEIEFAVEFGTTPEEKSEFCVLQMRPIVVSHEWEDLTIEVPDKSALLCRSSHVMGNGIITDISDIVFVDIDKFERASSREAAEEIGRFNHELTGKHVPYMLVGVGRWGSSDPWLGIPVTWEQISGAKVMVETGFKDFKVTPSQGTHFFQNLISFRVGYFTIDDATRDGFVDWEWLSSKKPVKKGKYTRHVHFDAPLTVQMDGRNNEGVILKPAGA
jgi:hypothetical protein